MKKINHLTFAGIYLWALFFLIRGSGLVIEGSRYHFMPQWQRIIPALEQAQLILLGVATIILVVGLSFRYRTNAFVLVFLWTFSPLVPFLVYALPWVTTYQIDKKGGLHFVPFYTWPCDVACGVILITLGAYFQFFNNKPKIHANSN